MFVGAHHILDPRQPSESQLEQARLCTMMRARSMSQPWRVAPTTKSATLVT